MTRSAFIMLAQIFRRTDVDTMTDTERGRAFAASLRLLGGEAFRTLAAAIAKEEERRTKGRGRMSNGAEAATAAREALDNEARTTDANHAQDLGSYMPSWMPKIFPSRT